LTLSGDVTVTGSTESSGASPAATISNNASTGKLDLGSLVTGTFMTDTRTITVGDSATRNIAADLNISAPISGASSNVSLTVTGTGTLELSGANTYTGPTRITAGTVDI